MHLAERLHPVRVINKKAVTPINAELPHTAPASGHNAQLANEPGDKDAGFSAEEAISASICTFAARSYDFAGCVFAML